MTKEFRDRSAAMTFNEGHFRLTTSRQATAFGTA
jgi:hypothetical protein